MLACFYLGFRVSGLFLFHLGLGFWFFSLKTVDIFLAK